MKQFFSTLCAILLAFSIGGCAPKPSPLAPVTGEESMKGYELYSWEQDGQWYFSVLVGTNREKTLEEIQASGVTLKGVDGLKAVLESIPSGQYVTWTAGESLPLPPEEVIQQVRDICTARRLELGLADGIK
ncbi:MAG: hypothetical protein ACOY0R_21630 [Chloroflexota bacterium]